MNNKEEQFKKIIADNSERIKRICNYYAPAYDDRQDIYQEILINIWKSLPNFKGNAMISTWIYRVAVNTALSFTGKAFKNMQVNISIETQNLNLLTDNDASAIKKEEDKQFEKLKLELNQLSVIDKALISLMLEGLSMKEIADIIGITEPNAKVKIHRIKESLRTKLNNKGNHN